MGMNKDQLTTLLGALGAAATAAQPVINAAESASLHSNDYLQLGTAVLFGLLGWATNKK